MHPVEIRGLRHDAGQRTCGPQPEYRLSLTLVLDDPEALWRAAVAQLRGDALSDEDIIDTIGPADAPDIAACIIALCAPAMLATRDYLPGCRADDFWIDAMPGLPGYQALRTI